LAGSSNEQSLLIKTKVSEIMNSITFARGMMKFLATGMVMMFIGCDDFVTPPPVVPPAQPEDRTPSWSPDGQWIAYTHINPVPRDTTYPTGLYLIDTDGQNRRLLLTGPVFNPDWSPDGKKIAFNSGNIFMLNIMNNSLFQITTHGSAFFASWSPDGKKIAYDATSLGDKNGIWIVSVDTTFRKRLGLGRDPDWSPQGDRLVYEGPPNTTKSESQIWVADTSGLNLQQLTSNAFIANRNPNWSPDGLAIAWAVSYSGKSEIWLMNSDGSNQHKIADGLEPSWSPDSQQLVFSHQIQPYGKMVLWIVNVDETNLRQLTH
jgi:Tol biopolymer transport system component